MEDLAQSRLASILTLIVGVYTALSPIWVTMSRGEAASFIATGSVIGVASLIQMIWKNALPSWVMLLAAVWLFISAFLFGASSAVSWNGVVAAVIVFLLAAWDGSEVNHFNQHHHQMMS